MEKLRAVLFIFVFMMLSACITSNKEIYAPDGGKAQKITCVNHMTDSPDPAKCYEKAGKVCGARGYQVIDKPFYSVGKMSVIIRCNSADSTSTAVASTSETTSKSLFSELNKLTNCVWDQNKYVELGGEPELDGNWYDKTGLGDLASNPDLCYRNDERHGMWITRYMHDIYGYRMDAE